MSHFKLSLAVAATLISNASLACTNFIVGKSASTDGSVICSYNADSYGMFGTLCHYAAATHAAGEMRTVIDWDTNVRHGQIPEATQTYNVVGNVNEWQVCITETTYGGREEMVDNEGILDYGSLIYIGLQRSKTAREAIRVMTSLAETYGYCSEGETFSICDANEAWIMEMMGKGKGSRGVVWVAIRIPDNAICAHANQSRIGKFMKLKKGDEMLCSADVIQFARTKGWYNGNDTDFSWKNVYAHPDFEGRRFCEARVWSFFRKFADMQKYEPWALGIDPNAEDMPLWIVPTRKVSVRDVMNSMRDHHEGTSMSLADTTSTAGGIWQMPYRPSPLTYNIDGKEYFNERPTSTQQTAFTMVAQLRSSLPRQVGGIIWFGNDDANMVAYTPVYCCTSKRPTCYATPGADATTFRIDNAFWLCNMVANIVYPRYSQIFPELQERRNALEDQFFAAQPLAEAEALNLIAQGDTAHAISFLEDYASLSAQSMMSRWAELLQTIVVKYNDMTVKPTDENGEYKMTPEGLPVHVIREGYPSSFARQMDKKEVPQSK